MKTEIDTVKGFQDYLPPESLKREAIKKIVEKWFKLYGFSPVETPIIEFDELMQSNTEDEAVSDRFRLKDKGNRELGLRYEFTFQLARILKKNPTIKLPFKRYQIGEVFRDEPLRVGRTRQFTQSIVEEKFDGWDRKPLNVYYVAMTQFYTPMNSKVAFKDQSLKNLLGEMH